MNSRASGATVELHDVSIDFGDGALVQDVSLRCHPGDIISIQGANGSGKTSLLRVLANVASPAGGRRNGPPTCAYVPPTIDPLPFRSGDWLRLFPRLNRADPRRYLHALGFDSDLSKRLADLSFGNLRKLLLAEALSSGEALIVIDEFTAGLDRHGSFAAAQLAVELANAGTTILLADQQDRTAPAGTRRLQLEQRALVPRLTASASDSLIQLTLQGPSEHRAALTSAALPLGFEPI